MNNRQGMNNSSSSNFTTPGSYNYPFNSHSIFHTPEPQNPNIPLSSPFFSQTPPGANNFFSSNSEPRLPPPNVDRPETAYVALKPEAYTSMERQMEILTAENKLFHQTFNELMRLQSLKDMEIAKLNNEIKALNPKRNASHLSSSKSAKKPKVDPKIKKSTTPAECPPARPAKKAKNNFTFFSTSSSSETTVGAAGKVEATVVPEYNSGMTNNK